MAGLFLCSVVNQMLTKGRSYHPDAWCHVCLFVHCVLLPGMPSLLSTVLSSKKLSPIMPDSNAISLSWPAYNSFNNYSVYFGIWSLVAQTVKNLPAMRETWVQSLGWEDPLGRAWQPTPVFLPGESYGQRNLAGYSLWSRRVGHDWATKHTHAGCARHC